MRISLSPSCRSILNRSYRSFFDNKGAVAGTFFAVGLAVIGLIITAVVLLKRRRRRFRHEEDEIYFEKYHEPPVQESDSPHIGHGSGPHESSHDVAAMTYARTDAYPDRAIHHGWVPPSAEAEFSNPQDYGMEYPPGTAYGAAQTQGGHYQYSGQTGAAGMAGHGSQAQYGGAARRTSPGPHPFADPSNTARRGPAPPVARSAESYHNDQAYGGTAY